MPVSDATLLGQTQDAISAILTTGQSYTINGSRTLTHANLPDLFKAEARLKKRLLLANGYTGKNHADFSSPDRFTADPPEV